MDANNGSETTTTTAPAAPAGPTKAELRAAELKANREAKAAAKEARKAELAEKRAGGIIGTLKAALDTANGTTRNEILEVLKTKFPERDAVGMSVTVGIQLSRLAKTTGRKIVSAKVEGRGRVYGFENVVLYPAIMVEGTPATNAVLDGKEATVEEFVDHAGKNTVPAESMNETLSGIGNKVIAAAKTATPEPTPAKPALTVSSGKGKGGKGKGGKK